MKIEGIDGESVVRGRTGFMEVLAVNWSVQRSSSAVKAGARGEADVQVQEIGVSRQQDSLSALLVNEAAFGTFDRPIEIEFTRTGPGNKPATYLRIVLEQAGLTSYSLASAGDTPTEAMTINFVRLTMASFQVTNDLNAVPNVASIDVATGKP
jgi:type VI protein secretion system component Hcp